MIESFQQAMRSAGLETQDEILADGLLHRFRVAGDKAGTQNGWYVLHGDEMPAGQFGSFKLGISETWSSKDYSTMSDREKSRFAENIKAAGQRRAEEEKRLRLECQDWCKKTLASAKDASSEHPYLARKKVKAYGIKQLGENLLIPLRDGAAVVHGIQFIMPDGSKKFKTGTAKQGNYFSIGRPKDNTLLICEGFATGASLHESTGHAVAVAFDAGNIEPVAEILRAKFPEFLLIICADDDHLTEGNPGLTRARKAAVVVGGKLAVPDFGPDRPEKATDFNDLATLAGLDAVRSCIEAAAIVADNPQRCGTVADYNVCNALKTQDCCGVADRVPKPDSNTNGQTEQAINEVVARLAALPPFQYDQERKAEAESLGIRTSTLDQAVRDAQRNGGTASDLPFQNVDPWAEPVDPAAVLSGVASTVRRFIVCSAEISVAVSLWAAMTWLMDSVQVAPLAVITAPEKRCGKSQLLSLLGRLSCRPITASSISPAALFRAIDAWAPTLLIDEVDACMKDNEELRGIINSGHTRDSAYVIRTVGDAFIPTKFNTWGAKALSGIGHVADTLMDRAVILELRRKLPHENVDRLRYAEPGLFENLASKLARFAEDYGDQVRQARPYLPPALNDRAQDNWEPLLAIAMVAGPEWLETATKAALKLSGSEAAAQSIGVELLTDISEIFETRSVDRISTADLIKALIEDDEKPWATFNRGFPIKPRQLASRLKGYGISSKTIRLNSLETPKGFERRQFEEAFSRYIPSPPPVSATPPQANKTGGSSVADSFAQYSSVADKNACEGPKTLACGVVADRKNATREKRIVEVTI